MLSILQSTDDFLKTAALAGAIVAFFVGLYQYKQAQTWKRAEWVAQEMRLFFGNAHVRRALVMIDWGRRDIVFPTEAPNPGKLLVHVTDAMVTQALKHHKDRDIPFSQEEQLIRDAFDHFLDGLERFASFRAAKLVSPNDLKPYLAYWLHNVRMSEDGDHRQRLVQLRRYIEQYGFRGVQRLFEDYRSDPLQPATRSDWWRYDGKASKTL